MGKMISKEQSGEERGVEKRGRGKDEDTEEREVGREWCVKGDVIHHKRHNY